ncbi:MAG: UbiD family decarboxylase [Ignavibacteriales bacterium]|nr:UbiD family decarboxylase [Ignavibacteriales bacterium]
MAFLDFQSYLQALKNSGELHQTVVEIDPNLELTEIARRAILENKPALLVENPSRSKYPLVINHFASPKRIEIALGREPESIGNELISFLDKAFPPTLQSILDNKQMIKRLWQSRPKQVAEGLSQQIVESPDLDLLPVQFCWPGDGGRFLTYGQVITYHPVTGRRNIGVYRMHVFDKSNTGMHWQIQKGGGFHYYYSEKLGKEFELAVALGTSPALTLATIAALPEGFDEALFAGFLQNKRIRFARGKSISIEVPSEAEFVLEGIVPHKLRRMEGPFGDHFGHYSAAAEFPVFQIKAITHRHKPVYPATVVGKPPMEDKFLGDATQQMLGPLIKLIHKEVTDIWAYYEAGFHNLLVASIEQRYQKEAIKAALGMMGTDQLSLTKCIILVSAGVDVRNWNAVLREIKENFDPHFDFIMIPKVPLDTLDFTSYKMNLGSKMIIDATRKERISISKDQNFTGLSDLRSAVYEIDSRIRDLTLIDNTLLIVKVSSDGREILEKLVQMPLLKKISLISIVSEDINIQDKENYIWGIFTRFDCERDIVFTEQSLVGISPVYKGVMGIDATWKPGYPEPLFMKEEIVKRVDQKWNEIWKK